MRTPDPALVEAISEELAQPVLPEVAEFAAQLGARPGVAAVLFYGSCLQKRTTEGLLDFYVLTDAPGAYGEGALRAWAGRRLPPNVYQERSGDLRAKVAVAAVKVFRARMSPARHDTTFWARFSQRAAIVWARDDAARAAAAAAVAAAVETGAVWAARLAPETTGPDAWRALYAATYGAELRVESAGRGGDIVSADEARFARLWPLTAGARAENRPHKAARAWAVRRRIGKVLNALRLIKAAFTFKGGLDYAIWKVERHSGRKVDISPWQRRWPLLGAPTVFLKLLLDRRLR